MNKKYNTHVVIVLLIIFITLAFIKLFFRDAGSIVSFNSNKEWEKDLSKINIIDSETNIKTISIDDLKADNIKKFKIEDLINKKIDNALVMGQFGEIEYIEGGVFNVKSYGIEYIDKGNRKKLEGVKGIMIDPPSKKITDSYYHMTTYLEEGEKVLFILLDGFAYHQYLYAVENGYAPFLSIQPKAVKATSVYRPVTNAGLAAMLTGKSPVENGVYSRSQRKLKADTIFKLVQNLNKEAIYIEGDIGILKTEIEPILNIDTNGDGFTDDEVFESTMKAIDGEYDLIFTHFHGIDDCGHSYGDLAAETLEFITRVDEYIKELASKWDGKIIITADHGMHTTEYGGNHGEFRYEDMIVPYMIFDGGK